MNASHVYRICVLGPKRCGKTALINRLVNHNYFDVYQPTVEQSIYYARGNPDWDEDCLLEIEDYPPVDPSNIDEALSWPLMGEKIRAKKNVTDEEKEVVLNRKDMDESINPISEIRPRHAFLVCFSVADMQSFREAGFIVERVLNKIMQSEAAGEVEIPVMIVGNMCDVRQKVREVRTDDGFRYSDKGVKYQETSARYNKHVGDLFKTIFYKIKGHNPIDDVNKPSVLDEKEEINNIIGSLVRGDSKRADKSATALLEKGSKFIRSQIIEKGETADQQPWVRRATGKLSSKLGINLEMPQKYSRDESGRTWWQRQTAEGGTLDPAAMKQYFSAIWNKKLPELNEVAGGFGIAAGGGESDDDEVSRKRKAKKDGNLSDSGGDSD